MLGIFPLSHNESFSFSLRSRLLHHLISENVLNVSLTDEVSTNLGEVESRENGPDLEFRYHDHDQMTRYLRSVSARYPALTALYSIGKSVQGWY